MNIVLFGFKGSGKTYFGKKLANQLQVNFIDTDDLLEKVHGLDARALLRKVGEANFRKLEKDALQGLQSVSDSVISLGGGAILTKDTLKIPGHFVYLKTPKELLKKRVLIKGNYPSFIDQSSPEASFDKMYNERLPKYEAIAAIKIDTGALTEAQVLNRLEEIFNGK